ncbi:hypothetical protein PAAG_08887 [Paracoccidioides lutzii Pb01]|uniref:Zn(2)-C6 fungal-type domain-containing protein n=1 Tax=Paracoccidioides lutzii (strain ATCC MYA-826 / Pb01) TaxID=502779 RepID=C1HDN0_PARBA|nr:hypothetical protein PAAG_08887 [Paracoccidioides lutzii Pb01]EEH40024.2 hypothetical protein PAAG_08887 [Paracoccidioides lutzii Pb01]
MVGGFTRMGLTISTIGNMGLGCSISWSRLGQTLKVPIAMCPVDQLTGDLCILAVIVPFTVYSAIEFGYLRPRARRREKQDIAKLRKRLQKRVLKRKTESAQAISMMRDQVLRRQDREAERDGLVIVHAEYGCPPSPSAREKKQIGPMAVIDDYDECMIDVTIPVAALVDQGQLVISPRVIKVWMLSDVLFLLINKNTNVLTHAAPQNNSNRYQPQEQLPPVRQLLTPISYSDVPNSHYYIPGRRNSPLYSSGTHGSSPTGEAYDARTLTTRHPSHGRVSSPMRPPVPDSVEPSYGGGQYPAYSREHLPPLSHVGLSLTSLPSHHFPDYTRNSNDAPLTRYHRSQLSFERDLPNSEASPVSNPSSLAIETALRSPSPTSQSQPRLAHVVDERYIGSEGLCYIYSDGTHCPKLIDGELVNANWGITKAGKPRKRLAQACITCRDKKIKCIPNVPKCDQCQKSGRECKFENAPRGNQAAKALQQLPIVSEQTVGHHGSSTVSTISQSQRTGYPASGYSTSSLSIGSPRDLISTSSHSNDSGPTVPKTVGPCLDFNRTLKRRRRSSTNAIDRAGDNPKPYKDMTTAPDSYPVVDILSDMAAMDLHDPTLSEWETDPYQNHPESTMHYVDRYFKYVNGATYCIFPREPFIRWLRFCVNKSLDDKMLLYAMLAMGAIFGNGKEHRADAMRFARIAKHAVEKSQNSPTLHLAQTRIILGMWHFTIGASATASDFTGSAMRTICGLKLNVEHGASTSGSEWDEFFQAETILECQRRTFWAAFLMDRHTSLEAHSPTVLKPQDIFLRLPLREDWYESQKWANMPYFENGIILSDVSLLEERNALDPMAFLVEVSAIWGDVLEHIYRSTYVSSPNYAVRFGEFYDSTVKRTDKWLASLPQYFSYNVQNLELSVQAGKADVFVSVHILYHATMMRLNRYARCQDLPYHIVERNVRRSHQHSIDVLRIALDLSQFLNTSNKSRSSSSTTKTTFSTPLTGNAILSATDVLSAGGSIREAPYYLQLISAGMDLTAEVARFWHSAREQLRIMELRVGKVTDAIRAHGSQGEKRGFAVQGLPLDLILVDKLMPNNEAAGAHAAPTKPSKMQGSTNPSITAKRGDLVYCLTRDEYFRALGLNDISVQRDEVLWISCEDEK